ncbi:hypothetical protein [Leifsonia sp. Root227]|uniref:hypothetical protein n=1 Tax=Leifsonia sp. Root227 TaxID=1736496 RepID=UPI000AFBE474|nr:hypothetical protein [Leifsonia sp. Root227]
MADTRNELTVDDTGIWLVTTSSGSVYRFDLDMRTVERVGGEPRLHAAPADTLQPLRSIVTVRVGQPGRWWMRNLSGGYTDASEVWQWSSVVVGIKRCQDAGTAAGDGKGPLSE